MRSIGETEVVGDLQDALVTLPQGDRCPFDPTFDPVLMGAEAEGLFEESREMKLTQSRDRGQLVQTQIFS
ncbi:MAG: hypothetical protein AAFX40_01325 [Cyanobacteria bacterium J06639_1]